MARAAFYRTMTPADRTAFDAEIRRRGYADMVGLVGWLAEHGVRIRKSVVWTYVRKLRRADECMAPVEFSDTTKAAILECATLIIRLVEAIRRIETALSLQTIRDERDPDPE